MKIGITERGDAAIHYDEAMEAHQKMDMSIFITKNPKFFLTHELPKNVILHCTITGFGGTVIEPNVRSCHDEIAAYMFLIRRHGKDRIVLRVDPLIPTPQGNEKATPVIMNCRGRIRISFMDMYNHVVDRFLASPDSLKCIGLEQHHLRKGSCQQHVPIPLRLKQYDYVRSLLDGVGCKEEIEVCGEPDFKCTGCISQKDLDALNISVNDKISKGGWQRPACACLAQKTELLTHKGKCNHNCIYCYWK